MKREKGQAIFIAVLFLTTFGYLLATAGELTEVSYPVRFKSNSDVVISLNWIQLKKAYVQKSNEPLVIEAEESTRIILASKNMVAIKDPDASGGYYLQFVSELENQIFIRQPGDYQVWYRAYFPFRGNWNHFEQMDEGIPNNVQDSLNGPDKEWLWIKGPVYKLTEGWHTYLFPSPTAWYGGARLDKIVLALQNSFEPTGMGPAPSAVEMPASGELISNRLKLDGMVNWRLIYEKEERGGKVEAYYSYDRGKTWQPVEKDKSYPVTSESMKVTFRFQIIRSPEGNSPLIGNVVLAGTAVVK